MPGRVLLFGGGVKRGYLHGRTAEERPCKTVEKRVVIEDLHASIYRALGISPKLAYEIEKRPFYVTGRPGQAHRRAVRLSIHQGSAPGPSAGQGPRQHFDGNDHRSVRLRGGHPARAPADSARGGRAPHFQLHGLRLRGGCYGYW